MQPIYFDERWVGPHGIGRFATEIMQRLPGIVPLQVQVAKLSLLDPLALSWRLRTKQDGIYFSPGFNAPLRCNLPMALTLHDLIHVQLSHPPHIRAYYQLIVRPAVRKARWIFTVSETSKRQILGWADIPSERIYVVGNGLSADFSADGPACCLEQPYFLHVGSHARHKNVPTLITAFSIVRRQTQAWLLFTQPLSPSLQQQVQRLGLEASVKVIDRLDDAGLARVYRGSAALVYPSLQEGFGLPVIEAMACGTPVISSDIEAIRETAGDGNAILIAPTDPDAIAEAMLHSLCANGPDQQLRERSIRHASRFDWDKVAGRIVAALATA